MFLFFNHIYNIYVSVSIVYTYILFGLTIITTDSIVGKHFIHAAMEEVLVRARHQHSAATLTSCRSIESYWIYQAGILLDALLLLVSVIFAETWNIKSKKDETLVLFLIKPVCDEHSISKPAYLNCIQTYKW